jgi:hypothetical protein
VSIHTGGCRCGAVRFNAREEPGHVSYCHCSDCRRAGGAPYTAFVGFETKHVAFAGKALKMYENGVVTRSFCGICGSPIAYVDERLEDHIYFLLGVMDHPDAYTPTVHAYLSQKMPYVVLCDGLPQLERTSVPRPTETAE